MVKIRLSRGGRIHKPIYTIVATNSRNHRDGRFLERLGQYDPNDQDNPLKGVKVEKIAAWVNKGAALSDTVRTLLKRNNLKLN